MASGRHVEYVAIHASWIVVLLAGAAVSLVDVFDLSSRFAALLGFVVVVFQGIDRVFDRTAPGAQADDRLRQPWPRSNGCCWCGGRYADAEDAVRLFAERCEGLLAKNDETMIDYFARLTRGADT